MAGRVHDGAHFALESLIREPLIEESTIFLTARNWPLPGDRARPASLANHSSRRLHGPAGHLRWRPRRGEDRDKRVGALSTNLAAARAG